MTPGSVRPELVAERAAWIRDMVAKVRRLPLASFDEFESDPRNVASAESYVRRALEALLDLGRHVLSKGFARAPAEYKDIALALGDAGVLDPSMVQRLVQMAGYRNRMVHFYHQVTEHELYQICTTELRDVEEILDAILAWVQHSRPSG